MKRRKKYVDPVIKANSEKQLDDFHQDAKMVLENEPGFNTLGIICANLRSQFKLLCMCDIGHIDVLQRARFANLLRRAQKMRRDLGNRGCFDGV